MRKESRPPAANGNGGALGGVCAGTGAGTAGTAAGRWAGAGDVVGVGEGAGASAPARHAPAARARASAWAARRGTFTAVRSPGGATPSPSPGARTGRRPRHG